MLDWQDGNRLTLYRSGAEYFPALVAAIDAARDEIHLETYLYADDRTGRQIAAALGRAALRGVTVRLLVDGFGAGEFSETLMPELLGQGVQVLLYRPELARFRLRRHRLRRLHRKLSVIDGRLAFVGGINLIDDYNIPEQMLPRFDYMVSVEGPVLGPIHHAVQRLWRVVVWANFRRRYRQRQVLATVVDRVGQQQAAFVVRDNFRHRRAIEEAYLDAIGAARDEIIIACAYFLPGRRFRLALHAAVARGVRVSILLQGRVEYRLLHFATQALYRELLEAGVVIHEYQHSFLHAKVAVIDQQWATVGSSNIDPFSLLLAKESNLVANDTGFADELRQSLLAAIAAGATRMEVRHWRRLPWHARIFHWASYALVRLAIGLAGYGGQH